uniref:Acyl-coenzyme A oxidase n=1 Tax=Strigamia maritima TaxID=126957 RepID=T1IU94_STRMM
MGSVNPELIAEREKATFSVKELTTILDGGEENTEERHRIDILFSQNPNIPNPLSLLGLSSDEYYKRTLDTSKHVFAIIKENGIKKSKFLQSSLDSIFAPSGLPTSMHDLVFHEVILAQSTKQQLSEWLPLAENHEIIGAFAQTELGHGSDIQNLETIATYDKSTEEFVINSPSLTSTKIWSGALGRIATHAAVVAQLYTNDKCCGIHVFIVQLRDLNDHSNLPRIIVGEMGPKMGWLGLDNGYLRLDHVRIPRKNMLMKHSKVLKDGTYVKPDFDRANYGTMVFFRCEIVKQSADSLAHASTIAVRYNAVRRQGKIEKRGEDVKILDYKTQQYELFPQVALSYSFYLVHKQLTTKYMQLGNNALKLNEFHALAAGMKSLSTSACAEGSEACRRACGGFGYLLASRLPLLCTKLIASCTYEGDNSVLRLQTSRFLIKSIGLLRTGKPIANSVEYLKGQRDYGPGSCMLEFLRLFEATSAEFVNDVFEKLKRGINIGLSEGLSWQENTVELLKCAHLHSKVFVIDTLHLFFVNTQMSTSLRAVLEKLFRFLAVYWILGSSGDFIEYGKLSVDDLQRLRSQIPVYLKDLRVDIVSLVDAFDFSDAVLQSVIGSYDGRAYERIYDYWSKLPSNEQNKSKL